MRNLKHRAVTVVSLVAALPLLLLLSPAPMHSQTFTYSSPVRVTNTPLPVADVEQNYNATSHLADSGGPATISHP